MKPVDQTEFGQERGNCLMACVASIFEVPLESLPTLTVEHDDGSWWDALDTALLRVGHTARFISNAPALAPPGYHIASGLSVRGLPHAVVALDGAVVHDPHPSRAGVERIEHWYLLLPLAERAAVDKAGGGRGGGEGGEGEETP